MADDCAVSAFLASRPFFVIYDVMGSDSHLMRGLVKASSGPLWLINYDGNPSGGGGDLWPTIDQQVCESPVVSPTTVDRSAGEMPIACGSLGSPMRVCP
jgi:hypothetical protein